MVFFDSDEKEIEDKFNILFSKIKSYFDKYGYEYNEPCSCFCKAPNTGDDLARIGSLLEISNLALYKFEFEYYTLKCVYLPNGKTSISSVRTLVDVDISKEFDFDLLEKWLESQKNVFEQIDLYKKNKQIQKKIKNLDADFK